MIVGLKCTLALLVLVGAVASSGSMLVEFTARADSSTPSVVPVSTVPTAVAVTPEITITSIPTITVEQPTLEIPPTPMPTSPPRPTSRPVISPTRLPTVSVSVTDSTPTPAPVATATAPTVPLPSPAQLRQSARLRWGSRVPASVRRWAFLIVPAARRYNVDPNLVAAVMTMESNGDPQAWSNADARGLMQVLHGPWDPAENIDTGVRMLAEYLNQFGGDIGLALAAYNAGPNAVQAYNGIPPYRETHDYVIIVRYLYDLYSHHTLTTHRKLIYRKTLTDLRHFARERKRIHVLARIAHIRVHEQPAIACPKFLIACGDSHPVKMFSTHDPFWPVGNAPDPLQRVDPEALLARGRTSTP